MATPPFDWSDYYALAEYILENVGIHPNPEACYRTVTSRAYYAVYCMTRDYCQDEDGFESFSNDHQRLQNHLINHHDDCRKRIGNRLKQLHQNRKKADYDTVLSEPANKTAQRSIIQAGQIIEQIAQLRKT